MSALLHPDGMALLGFTLFRVNRCDRRNLKRSTGRIAIGRLTQLSLRWDFADGGCTFSGQSPGHDLEVRGTSRPPSGFAMGGRDVSLTTRQVMVGPYPSRYPSAFECSPGVRSELGKADESARFDASGVGSLGRRRPDASPLDIRSWCRRSPDATERCAREVQYWWNAQLSYPRNVQVRRHQSCHSWSRE